ncbi:putative MFS-type transporter SLC18B1 [Apostichopus japonicus]|uniref:Putative MFS-type transporter SLC18B1 n=1 Tax=Stichopus japonicus TaxID=307972 RepID=A0A2G8K887_STIJA|nr:putative MFS-type transporter SLC18B1 [Apostichopus japonicus]
MMSSDDKSVDCSVNDVAAVPSIPPLTRRQKIIFFAVGTCYLFDMMSFSILAPFFPIEAEVKGISSTAVGFIFGIFNLIIFFAAPIFGKYLPVLGAKYLFLAGSFVAGSCNILFGLLEEIPDPQMFLIYCFAIRAIEALGVAASMTAVMTIAANAFPHRVARVIGLLETFSGAGFMIGPPLGGFFYGIGGYKLPFIVLGLVCLTSVTINIFILPSVGVDQQESGSVMKMLQIPAVYPVALGMFVGSASLVFLDPTLSVHLSTFDVSPEIIGVIFLLFGGFYGAVSPLWGYVADKTESTRIMMVLGYFFLSFAFLCVGPTSLFFFKLPQALWMVILGLAVVGLALGCALVPALLDLLSSATWYGLPNDLSTQAVVSGLFNSFFSLGAFVGPTLGGYMVDRFGFMHTATGLAMLNFVVMWIILLFSMWEYRCGKGRRTPWRFLGPSDSRTNEVSERSPLLSDGAVQC